MEYTIGSRWSFNKRPVMVHSRATHLSTEQIHNSIQPLNITTHMQPLPHWLIYIEQLIARFTLDFIYSSGRAVAHGSFPPNSLNGYLWKLLMWGRSMFRWRAVNPQQVSALKGSVWGASVLRNLPPDYYQFGGKGSKLKFKVWSSVFHYFNCMILCLHFML